MAQLIAPTLLNKPLSVKKTVRGATNYIVLHYDDGGSYKSTRRTLIKKRNRFRSDTMGQRKSYCAIR